MTHNPHLHNAHLNGSPFTWEAGENAVLLMHGLTATPTEVRGLAKNLHAAGYTVHGPLLPGHGSSPQHLNRTRWEDWAQTARRSYESLAARYPRVFVGGESTGAVLALMLAAENPEIAGVLAYAPAVKLALSPQQVFLVHLLAPFVSTMPKKGLDGEKAWQGYRVNPLRAVQELLALQKVVLRNLHKVHQPLLVMQGRKDQTISPDCAGMVIKGAHSRHKEQYWLENSAHCLLLDREMDEVTHLTLAFMRCVLEG